MSETTTEAVQDNVQEVATDSQNQEPTNPEVGNLIAEARSIETGRRKSSLSMLI